MHVVLTFKLVSISLFTNEKISQSFLFHFCKLKFFDTISVLFPDF